MKAIALGLVVASLLWPLVAAGLDVTRYAEGDLDKIVGEKRPDTGARVFTPRKLSFDVTIEAYGRSCDSAFLKKVMVGAGAPKPQIDALPITKCIRVRSANGALVSMFIQDKVAAFLPKEVPPGGAMRIYCDYLFLHKSGPGLLINDFQAKSSPGARP